jgi:hypothetical protein
MPGGRGNLFWEVLNQVEARVENAHGYVEIIGEIKYV